MRCSSNPGGIELNEHPDLSSASPTPLITAKPRHRLSAPERSAIYALASRITVCRE